MSLRLAHLSDAHIGPLPRPRPHELAGKRLTGYINWSRRAKLHDMGVLGLLVADMQAHAPGHIAMTGDILNLGLPAEFPLARSWLETLGAPADVSFTPGNHDAYTRSIMPVLSRAFAPWTGDSGRIDSEFPNMRIRGGVALIGLSSAVPTAPFIASGTLGPDQRAAFVALLRSAKAEGLARVVMIHHPPHLAGASAGRNLTDARGFEKIIATEGAELIIHGHNHRQLVARIAGPQGPVPIVGVASASAVPGTHGHRAAYHLFELETGASGLRISGRARGLMPGLDRIGDLGPLAL